MNTEKIVMWLCLTAWSACGHADDGQFQGNESEVITTVELVFTPDVGGDSITFLFDDPDGDGGDAPIVDDIELAPGTYAVAVRFENRLEIPAEDITIEVADESEEHQVFFTGSAVDGPASDTSGAPLLHRYSDQDLAGLPIGLSNSILAEPGAGELVLTLRHIPPVGESIIKTADVSTLVRESGFASIGGTSDVQVRFTVSVE